METRMPSAVRSSSVLPDPREYHPRTSCRSRTLRLFPASQTPAFDFNRAIPPVEESAALRSWWITLDNGRTLLVYHYSRREAVEAIEQSENATAIRAVEV